MHAVIRLCDQLFPSAPDRCTRRRNRGHEYSFTRRDAQR